MAGFLTNAEVTDFTAAYGTHFDTFKSQLKIWKTPIKTVVSSPNNIAYGYGGRPSTPTNYTLTTVSGVFDAQITLEPQRQEDELEDVKNAIPQGTIRIKVEQNARDFIEDGRINEKFEFENQIYNSITSDGIQKFLTKRFYIYRLQKTN